MSAHLPVNAPRALAVVIGLLLAAGVAVLVFATPSGPAADPDTVPHHVQFVVSVPDGGAADVFASGAINQRDYVPSHRPKSIATDVSVRDLRDTAITVETFAQFGGHPRCVVYIDGRPFGTVQSGTSSAVECGVGHVELELAARR